MIGERTERLLTARLAREQAEQRLPSVVSGLTRDGALVWTASRGRATGTPAPPDAGTQYRAGSITKTFVAVAVLRLRDAGRLSLTDPIGDYINAGQAGSMTIGQLLSHSAGLRAETAGPWWERTPGGTLADLAGSSLGPDAAKFRPGRRHHYSNVGYGLLGMAVSALERQPWHEVIADDLLQPLEMRRTTTRPEPPHATGYAVHPHADLLLTEPEHDAGAMAPAGQLWTTVSDLASWGRFLAGDSAGLLSAATLAEMREPVVINDPKDQPWTTGYGLGLQLWNVGGIRYYGHTGSMPGFVAVLQITAGPGSDTAISACNSTTGFGPALNTDLLKILADNDPVSPPEWAPAPVEPEVLGLLGGWFWGPAPYTLRRTGDLLELRREDASRQVSRFRQDGGGGWTGMDGYQAGETLIPVHGADGAVIALDIASFIFTRSPYDPAAPVPGGIDQAGWHSAKAD